MGCLGLESACIAVLSVPQIGKELAGAENSLELQVLLLLLRSARNSDLCASTVVYGVLGVEPSPFLTLTVLSPSEPYPQPGAVFRTWLLHCSTIFPLQGVLCVLLAYLLASDGFLNNRGKVMGQESQVSVVERYVPEP